MLGCVLLTLCSLFNLQAMAHMYFNWDGGFEEEGAGIHLVSALPNLGLNLHKATMGLLKGPRGSYRSPLRANGPMGP